MISKLDPEVLRANEVKMNKRGKIIGIAMMAGSILLIVIIEIIAYGSTIQRWMAPPILEMILIGGHMVSTPPSEGTSITVYYDPSNPQKSLTDTNKSDSLSDFAVWAICC